MAKPELGLKRQCMNCGAKFYDLSKDPAICPKCGTVFQAGLSGSTRVAAPAMARKGREVEEEDETEHAEGEAEVVSLQDVEAEEAAGDDETADDEAEESTNGDDDAFLEEEEGSDDVSDLIDGDIENDEES